MFKLTVKQQNIKAAAAWFNRFEDAVDDPQVMTAGVPHIGVGMAENFKAEGSAAGSGWASLSPTTQRIRQRRGYNPEHPILQQSGALKRMAADSLRRWGAATQHYAGSDGKGTFMAASASRRQFMATITGPKVENHWGGSGFVGASGRAVRLPRRRFFGITQDAADKACEAVNDKIMTRWARMSGTVKRIY